MKFEKLMENFTRLINVVNVELITSPGSKSIIARIWTSSSRKFCSKFKWLVRGKYYSWRIRSRQ